MGGRADATPPAAALRMTDQPEARPLADQGLGTQTVAQATGTLALLNEQADGLRAELARLRHNLVEVQREFSAERATELREANEKLVLAAMHAQSIADAAVFNLSVLARAAQRDTLTNTPNRALMLDRVESAIALARRKAAHIAVLFLDLDDFKLINDTLGHAVGDGILQLVARRLEAVVRESDAVSRHGGDEFLVLLTEISQAADAALIATKILSALAAPRQFSEHEIRLSASIGIAVYPGDGETASTLISGADAAMYRAKKSASGSFQFCSEETSGNRNLQPSQVDTPQSSVPNNESELAGQSPQIQHLREANEQLLLAALSAQELEEQAESKYLRQVRFMARVAHELRNPLNPIGTAAQLLKRAGRDEALLASLQGIIERQVVHMSQLVNDLLDGSRVSTGRFRLECSNVDMIQVISTSVETCRSAIDARRQHLKLELPPGPLNAYGDGVRLAQIFSNLLDNASKYTPEGGDITLALATEGETLVVTVSDNGIGITSEVLPGIFELFVQDEHALRLYNGGLGIGLAVVHDLVELHQGSVVATSAGKSLGSQFVVRLPILRNPG